MKSRNTGRQVWLAALVSIWSLAPQAANATIVEFQTVMGNFEVNLYDNSTPETVANFLAYVNNGDYSNSVIHRAVANFVIQGGAFTFDTALPLGEVPTRPTVDNEPVFSNVRGSIAMAKVGGDPNSATSQWFFNLGNNAANLDDQNGGFTAFGEVVGNGMDVVDAIAALPVYNFGGAVGEIPLRNYTSADFTNGVEVNDTHLVMITAVVVTDTTVDSDAGLNPPLTTAGQGGGGGGGNGGGGGGGGAIGFIGLFGLLLAAGLRIRRRYTV
jgi:peptidyl-prolyl cis-trans isomerase A (cyclophilin A)